VLPLRGGGLRDPVQVGVVAGVGRGAQWAGGDGARGRDVTRRSFHVSLNIYPQ
jgi:hypothetical protein